MQEFDLPADGIKDVISSGVVAFVPVTVPVGDDPLASRAVVALVQLGEEWGVEVARARTQPR